MFLLRVAVHLECVTVKIQKKCPGVSWGTKDELLFTWKQGYRVSLSSKDAADLHFTVVHSSLS